LDRTFGVFLVGGVEVVGSILGGSCVDVDFLDLLGMHLNNYGFRIRRCQFFKVSSSADHFYLIIAST
jgi:hypothetical protein